MTVIYKPLKNNIERQKCDFFAIMLVKVARNNENRDASPLAQVSLSHPEKSRAQVESQTVAPSLEARFYAQDEMF